MSSIVQEISLFWRSLSGEANIKSTLKKKEEKKIHTQKTTALVMLIKLYAALHFA